MRAKIKEAALHPNGEWEAMADLAGPQGVMPVGFLKEENRRYVGMRLSEIATEMGVDWPDAAMDLLASEGQRISSFYFVMREQNLRRQLQQPWIMVSTDAGGMDPAWAAATGPYHPARVRHVCTCTGKVCARRESHFARGRSAQDVFSPL